MDAHLLSDIGHIIPGHSNEIEATARGKQGLMRTVDQSVLTPYSS